VDDPWPVLVADERDLGEVVDEGVGQRPLGVAGPGVDDEARGLVDDDDVGVEIDDLDRDGLGEELAVRGPRNRGRRGRRL
jgi:hypothetical protein